MAQKQDTGINATNIEPNFENKITLIRHEINFCKNKIVTTNYPK